MSNTLLLNKNKSEESKLDKISKVSTEEEYQNKEKRTNSKNIKIHPRVSVPTTTTTIEYNELAECIARTYEYWSFDDYISDYFIVRGKELLKDNANAANGLDCYVPFSLKGQGKGKGKGKPANQLVVIK